MGRYGGEEFIIILNRVDKEKASLVIKRILKIIRNTSFTFNGHDINITFSGGISNCKDLKDEEITIDKLVEIADKRMYSAKEMGRNKIVA